MSVRSIEAEVSIKSGVQAECTIGREVVVEVHEDVNLESLTVTANGTYEPTEGIDGYDRVVVGVSPTIPDIEPLTVTENGTYTASGDGFNPVTVNVEAPKDPNVIEGEFIGTETGVLTIDLPYTGDSYPKALFIYDADGIIKEDVPRAYTISAYSTVKNNAQEPTYDGDTSNNSFRYQAVYTGTVTYTATGGSSVYIFSQTDPAIGTRSVIMPDNKTLKVYVTNSTASSSIRFRTGIRYKYKVFY